MHWKFDICFSMMMLHYIPTYHNFGEGKLLMNPNCNSIDEINFCELLDIFIEKALIWVYQLVKLWWIHWFAKFVKVSTCQSFWFQAVKLETLTSGNFDEFQWICQINIPNSPRFISSMLLQQSFPFTVDIQNRD